MKRTLIIAALSLCFFGSWHFNYYRRVSPRLIQLIQLHSPLPIHGGIYLPHPPGGII